MNFQVVFTNEEESFIYALLLNCRAILEREFSVLRPQYTSALFLKSRILEIATRKNQLTVVVRMLPPEMAYYSHPQYKEEIREIFRQADRFLEEGGSRLIFLLKKGFGPNEVGTGLKNIAFLEPSDLFAMYPQLDPGKVDIQSLKKQLKYDVIKRYYLITRDDQVFYQFFPNNPADCRKGVIRSDRSGIRNIKVDFSAPLDDDFCVIQAKVTPEINRIKEVLRKVYFDEESVFIYGESGTGKECIAQMVYFLRKMHGKKGKFVAQNCAGIPAELLESELFGYEKGSFTGATAPKKGLVKEAENGVLFLDEIDKMPLELQAKLLRFVQSKKVRPVGSLKEESVRDIKIVAASNVDPLKAIEEKKLLLDLYQRLSTILLVLPPLRRWVDEDKLRLINSFVYSYTYKNKEFTWNFLRERGIIPDDDPDFRVPEGLYYTVIPPAIIEMLLKHRWELGNARELRKTVIRYLVTGRLEDDRSLLEVVDTPDGGEDIFSVAIDRESPLKIEELQHRYALYIYNGPGERTISRSARLIGVTDQTFRKYLKMKSE